MPRPTGSRIFLLAAALAAAIVATGCTGPATSSSPSPLGASHEPAPAGFPLLGTWTTTITRDDLQAAGLTEEGILKENAGTFTWAFEADGTWRQVMVSLDGSPVMNPVFNGYYTVEGDVLTAVTEFPEIYRDEGLHYTFELDGDAVTFDNSNPPDPIWPVIIETHPWTRVTP
jgi:hypothetical protein